MVVPEGVGGGGGMKKVKGVKYKTMEGEQTAGGERMSIYTDVL